MAELTPSPWDIIIPNRGLRDLAQKANSEVTKWFRDEWWHSASVVATDFFHGNDMIDVSIEANIKRRKCVAGLVSHRRGRGRRGRRRAVARRTGPEERRDDVSQRPAPVNWWDKEDARVSDNQLNRRDQDSKISAAQSDESSQDFGGTSQSGRKPQGSGRTYQSDWRDQDSDFSGNPSEKSSQDSGRRSQSNRKSQDSGRMYDSDGTDQDSRPSARSLQSDWRVTQDPDVPDATSSSSDLWTEESRITISPNRRSQDLRFTVPTNVKTQDFRFNPSPDLRTHGSRLTATADSGALHSRFSSHPAWWTKQHPRLTPQSNLWAQRGPNLSEASTWFGQGAFGSGSSPHWWGNRGRAVQSPFEHGLGSSRPLFLPAGGRLV